MPVRLAGDSGLCAEGLEGGAVLRHCEVVALGVAEADRAQAPGLRGLLDTLAGDGEATPVDDAEEVLELAKKEGYKLSDAEMEAISGGGWSACSTDVWYGTGA